MELNLGTLPENQRDPEQLFIESRVEESIFQNYMPKRGFIKEYLEFTKISEAPGSFHFWNAMCVLSATLQRNLWLAKGIHRIYPNLYVVLVAPSGKCRKTESIRIGVDIAQKIEGINVIADKTTPEALLEALMDGPLEVDIDEDLLGAGPSGGSTGANMKVDSTAFIRSTEMSTFLNKATYSSGMITLLTDLFDCPDEFIYRTRNKKPVMLNNVSITMIAATTSEWLATNLPEAAFEGGFMSRIIWVVKYWRDRVIPFEESPDPKHMAKLVKMLSYIEKHHNGSVQFDQHAKLWYTRWYEKNAMLSADNEKLSGFHERLPHTLIKVAMLLQASEEPGNLILKQDYLIRAEKILMWSLEKMFRAFESTELSRMGQLRRLLNSILDHHGEVSQRDMLRKVAGRLDYKGQFEDVRAIMEEADEIRVYKTTPGSKGGRPKIMWRRPLQSELR